MSDFDKVMAAKRSGYDEGYRAGIEAAVGAVVATYPTYVCEQDFIDAIRALSQPREPTPSPAGAPDECAHERRTMTMFENAPEKDILRCSACGATRRRGEDWDKPAPTAAPKAPERDGLAGSGAVFCDPTTLSESQLRDTIGACLEHLNRRFPPKAPERGAP